MRISGYGSGFGQSTDSRDRAAAFRARHSIGQRVKGRILRRDPNGLYWVQVGGEELLARLEVQADPGDQLMFIVRALTPEITLQALREGMDAGDLPGLVQRFRSAREVFETQASALLALLAALPPQVGLRREAFAQAMERHPEDAARLAKTLHLLEQINASVPTDKQARGLYLPWLTPALRRQEMVRRPKADNGLELRFSALSTECADVEARLITAPDSARLNLYAAQPERSGPFQVECTALVRDAFSLEPELLGPTRLKPNPLGGVLGELFGSVPMWSSGGLNTRV